MSDQQLPIRGDDHRELDSPLASFRDGANPADDERSASPLAESGTLTEPLRVARRRFERDYVAAVLEQQRYNVRKAALVLGIQRTNLYRKLRTLQLRGVPIDTEN